MGLKIFKWHELNTEQKADLAMCNTIFAICFVTALALFVFGTSFNYGVLVLASVIVFVAGIFIARRFIKKAGGKRVIEDIPKQIKERVEKNVAEIKAKKEIKEKGILDDEEDIKDFDEIAKTHEENLEKEETEEKEEREQKLRSRREDFED